MMQLRTGRLMRRQASASSEGVQCGFRPRYFRCARPCRGKFGTRKRGDEKSKPGARDAECDRSESSAPAASIKASLD